MLFVKKAIKHDIFLHSFHSKKAINPVSSPEGTHIQGGSFLLLFSLSFCE